MHSIIEPQSLAVVICGIHRIFERFSVELASQDSLAGFIEGFYISTDSNSYLEQSRVVMNE